jgi:tRNA (pseudouridine54-N1)-methyltransferase
LFDGSRLKKVSPDERGIAIWIQKALALDIGKHWKERSPGIGVAALAFQDIIRMLRNRPIYVLHEHGRKIQDVDILADPVFVLGDHLGLPRAEERFALRYATDKVSLGKISYLSSTCISLLHWICDLRRI